MLLAAHDNYFIVPPHCDITMQANGYDTLPSYITRTMEQLINLLLDYLSFLNIRN